MRETVRWLGVVSGLLLLAFLLNPVRGQGQQAADAEKKYVGADKCKLCHMTQHKEWLESKHAKAWDALLDNEKTDPECVKCHVTGFGQPTGFESMEKTPTLVGVQCEACHGPGSVHMVAPKEQKKATIPLPTDACVKCHNPHKNMKKAAEEKRAAAGAAPK